MTKHVQVEVDYFGEKIQVDEGMAELLQLLWSFEIDTAESCQQDNYQNEPFIFFRGATSATKFMNLVAEVCRNTDFSVDIINWGYMVLPVDRAEEYTDFEMGEDGVPNFHSLDLCVRIQFPLGEIETLVAILKNADDNREYVESFLSDY